MHAANSRPDLKTIGVVIIAVLMSSCTHPAKQTIDLPQIDQIEGISATVFPGRDMGPFLENVSLTTDDYGYIRSLIVGARSFREAPGNLSDKDLSDKMGVIYLSLRNGEVISISYYWAGKPSVFLKVNGQDSAFVASDDRGRDLGMVITYYIRDNSKKK